MILRQYRDEKITCIRKLNDNLDRLVNGRQLFADSGPSLPNARLSAVTRYIL